LKAAVATSVSLRSYLLVQVKPCAAETPVITLNFPDIGLNHSWKLDELPTYSHSSADAPTSLDADLFKSLHPLLEPFPKEFQHVAVLAFLYLFISLVKPINGDITFLLRSSIPIGSGLGSSASISVCLATALLVLFEYIPRPQSENDPTILKVINDWAFLGEKCIHGNPSGVDNTVATYGGGVLFRKERRARTLSNGTFQPVKPAEKKIIQYHSSNEANVVSPHYDFY
jgi:mevalonate kinase